MSPRWRKVLRDLSTERGRALLMVAAIAISIMSVGTVLGAFAIMTREVPRNYLETRPASAALELPAGVDPALVDEVRQSPGIADAEAGDIVLSRAKVGDDWIPLLLFVVDDFRALRLNSFFHESGAWPPAEGTMLVERSAVAMLKASEGGSVLVKTPHGRATAVPITGLVHDPGLAPAWQEREGYGYITRATLGRLGEQSVLGELRILLRDGAADRATIEAKANQLAHELSARGHAVKQVRVPPPGKHPHQSQMMGVLFLMLSFSALALILSATLVATSIAALFARQVREIGVMKTIGAQSGQLAALYAAMVAALGLVAVVVALPVGVVGARGLAHMSASMLNLSLASLAIPGWVFAVQVAAGVLVPLAAAAVPIVKGSRISVRDAIDSHGASHPGEGSHWASAFGSIIRMSRVTSLALRNAFRRRTRAVLTLALLAAGGAMFMTALNISRGWSRIVDRLYENRSYDVEIRLNTPAAVAEQLRSVPGVRSVEPWGYSQTALWRADHVDVVRTYPDGSHGSLTLAGPPPTTDLVHFPLLAGRWLAADDTDAVVINHMVLSQAPGIVVGGLITLSLAGRPTTWRVVGIVEEVGSAGVAYVTSAAFERAAGSPGQTRMLRVATNAATPEARTEIIRALERRLGEAQVSVESVIPLAVLRTAMGDHVVVLIRMLLAMAALMVTVGMLGLASTMGTHVLERTREIGVMKTIGATPGQVAKLVLTEALLVGVASWIAALVLAVPLTALVGKTVGMLAFRVRLPLVIDPFAALTWLGLAALVAVAATLLPARRASRLTVWGALGHV
ncbi:MAG TPA: ABC transporter permease [Polyangiaceae bacterium]|nr:ABC transporter permease [Polyangiaceae bacterium]